MARHRSNRVVICIARSNRKGRHLDAEGLELALGGLVKKQRLVPGSPSRST
jgi:hypothetical protein